MLRENLDIVLRDLLADADGGSRIPSTPLQNVGLDNALLNAESINRHRIKRVDHKFIKTQNNVYGSRKRRATNEELKYEGLDEGKELDATVKAKYLYESCMNYKIIENRGHQPLLELLESLGGWPIISPDWDKSRFDWIEMVAKLRLYNNDILISEWVGPDLLNSDEFVIQIDQTNLGLISISTQFTVSKLFWLSRLLFDLETLEKTVK